MTPNGRATQPRRQAGGLSMLRTARLSVLTLVTGIALGLVGGQLISAQQQPIKRTDLLKSELAEIKDNVMHVWVADIAPGAATGRHFHPTPRFVYVLEGAVVLELDGKAPQMFKTRQGLAEMAKAVQSFRDEGTTEPVKTLGF